MHYNFDCMVFVKAGVILVILYFLVLGLHMCSELFNLHFLY